MPEKKKKNVLLIVILCLLVILILAAGGFGLLVWLNQPGKAIKEVETAFTIARGESVRSVADRLTEEGVIRSALFMRGLSRYLETESHIKAGTYTIPQGATVVTIHDLFVSGTQTLIRITIPEGFTISRIDALLAEKGLIQAGEFREACTDRSLLESFTISGKSAEGFLYPDTYFFSEKTSGKEIASAMVKNFFTRLAVIFPDFRELSPKDLYDKVILASIVEREYRVASEAPTIASVFYNRLRINMGLGSCATVEYIITEIQGRPHPKYLRKEDLEIRSDYNTYMWAGLPPGPISNPGAVALKAAFFPEKTNYMYFLLKNPSSGEHVFSKDIDEHNKAKYLYLKNSP